MTLKESLRRGYNLMSVAIVSLAGFAFAGEIVDEKEWGDKGDDIALTVLAIIAVAWYAKKSNRFKRSIAPVVFVLLALVTKLGAFIYEFSDKYAVGDDIGAMILFILASVFVIVQYKRTDAAEKAVQQGPEASS